MSETPGSYGKRYHELPARNQEQVEAAYHQALTSHAGQIVMDDLYRLVCFSHLPGERELGQHDLWIYILQRMAAHEARGAAYERSDV